MSGHRRSRPSSHPTRNLLQESSKRLALQNGGYYFDAGPSRRGCHGDAEKKRNQILDDYNAAEQKRQEKIYGPAEALIAQLKRMELP
jgi:hypothetical protein